MKFNYKKHKNVINKYSSFIEYKFSKLNYFNLKLLFSEVCYQMEQKVSLKRSLS